VCEAFEEQNEESEVKVSGLIDVCLYVGWLSVCCLLVASRKKKSKTPLAN